MPSKNDQQTIYDRLRDLIERKPGQTAEELSFSLFGRSGQRSKINFDCQLLLTRDLVVRTGEGGRKEPFRYSAAGAVTDDATP